MATKNNQFLLSKQKFFSDNGKQYSNLNLNQTFTNESFVHSKNKSNNNNRFAATNSSSENTVTDNCYQEKENSWNKSSKGLCSKPLEILNLHNKKEEVQKQWMKDIISKDTPLKSTLSLHIIAYENSIEKDSHDNDKNESKKFKKTKNMMGFVSKFEDPFEYPRQMKGQEPSTPQVMQFKASQKLLDPNQTASQTPQQQQQKSSMKQNPSQRNATPSSRQQQQPPSSRASGQIAEMEDTIIRSERPIREIENNNSLSGEGAASLRSRNKINPAVAKALEEIKAWFHGKMDRFKASKLLKKDGDFLIRLGKSMDDLLYKPVLSVKWGQRHYHFLIKEFNSLFWIEKSQFASIASLIRYYLSTKKPITQNSGVILGAPILSTKFGNHAAAMASKREKRMSDNTEMDLREFQNLGMLEATHSFSYALLGENAPFILPLIGKIAILCAVIIFLYICTVF